MYAQFHKYQGTGNDFIIIDNRGSKFPRRDSELIKKLCNRHFGIGADGLILLQKKVDYDFEMVYYNADGKESSMCGNGGRCVVEYARTLGLVKTKANFYAIDGEHWAEIKQKNISLKMNNVYDIEINEGHYFLNTGSPHYVKFVDNIEKFNVLEDGRNIRYNERFKKAGTNVNFVEKDYNELFVRTYERGVEGETLSCGTGVTAAALVAALKNVSTSQTTCEIKTLGGHLKVKFKKHSNHSFTDIWLEGPVQLVFSGEVEI